MAREGNGKGGKSFSDGDSGKRGYGQWLWQRGWQAFDGGNDGDSTKDTAARVTTGERGMMVATGHGLCVCLGVCGETFIFEPILCQPCETPGTQFALT
jgi:hypothetical protein